MQNYPKQPTSSRQNNDIIIIDSSHIDLKLEYNNASRKDIANQTEPISEAGNRHKFGVGGVVLFIILVAAFLGGLTYVILNNKSNIQSYEDSTNASLYYLSSLKGQGNSMCNNSGIYIWYPYVCSGCSSQILGGTCSSCINKYNNITITGSGCSPCNLTSSNNGYCHSCATCSVSATIYCYGNYSSITNFYPQLIQLTLNAYSCTGCSGNLYQFAQYSSSCSLCRDINNSGRTGSSCVYCYIFSNGVGFCRYCQNSCIP